MTDELVVKVLTTVCGVMYLQIYKYDEKQTNSLKLFSFSAFHSATAETPAAPGTAQHGPRPDNLAPKRSPIRTGL